MDRHASVTVRLPGLSVDASASVVFRSPKAPAGVADSDCYALLTIATLLAALAAAGRGGSTSSVDCDGHNGNAAIAACHPDDQAVLDACPDNSNGEEYAAPTDECLAVVGGSDGSASPEATLDENDPCMQEADRVVDQANADATYDATPHMSQECLDRGF